MTNEDVFARQCTAYTDALFQLLMSDDQNEPSAARIERRALTKRIRDRIHAHEDFARREGEYVKAVLEADRQWAAAVQDQIAKPKP